MFINMLVLFWTLMKRSKSSVPISPNKMEWYDQLISPSLYGSELVRPITGIVSMPGYVFKLGTPPETESSLIGLSPPHMHVGFDYHSFNSSVM